MTATTVFFDTSSTEPLASWAEAETSRIPHKYITNRQINPAARMSETVEASQITNY